MRRVFVCSPYRGGVERNLRVARETCRRVLREGDAPFAPHLLYPALLDDTVAADRELGIRAGIAWLATADEVLVVGEPTEGMRQEIAAADLLGVPIRPVAALIAVLAAMVCGGCVTSPQQPSAPPAQPAVVAGGT